MCTTILFFTCRTQQVGLGGAMRWSGLWGGGEGQERLEESAQKEHHIVSRYMYIFRRFRVLGFPSFFFGSSGSLSLLRHSDTANPVGYLGVSYSTKL